MSNKSNVKEKILSYISCHGNDKGCTTKEIAEGLNMQRSNVSTVLNRLYNQGAILKTKSKPVLYLISTKKESLSTIVNDKQSFDRIIGHDKSLKKCIQQAKAAILYPPKGLHTLILGPTGIGKTMFAEMMYKFAVESNVLNDDSPFVAFNCADYSNNPQLLLSHLFGCKMGAYTGALKDKEGLVDKADGGILFLDEVHRLPPEGQEMLFNLIDKGQYTALGDVDNKKHSNVLIICATTENVGDNLLSTFTRRIPMSITIPPLKDRTLDERFELICEFFKIESKRIGSSIEVSNDTIRSLLLYDAVGNVGQLKSDIQLGCANAFLKSVSSRKKRKIVVSIVDLPMYVKQGLLLNKNFLSEVNNIIKKEVNLVLKPEGITELVGDKNYSLPNNFYEVIENRVNELKEKGMDKEDIDLVISLDIGNYFKKYMKSFENNIDTDILSKVVDKNIISLVEEFLKDCRIRLNKVFSKKVFCGLCLHISSTIERIKNNNKIINCNLEQIVENHPEEYSAALKFCENIGERYNIPIPVDEVGFITMFLCIDEEERTESKINKPIVVVVMHGKSTASSMADVANRLIGEDNVFAYDMDLDEKPEQAYINIKGLIEYNYKDGGVIMLVDMGSLCMFGEFISEELGINVKVIEMVSTPMVIECARKAVTENNINKIWEDITSNNYINYHYNYNTSLFQTYLPNKDNIIITLCTTGEGSAIKLKNLIEQNIDVSYVQIIPLATNDKQYMYNFISRMAKEKNILCIVGTINPNIHSIPYISISDIIMYNNYSRIQEIIDNSYINNGIYDKVFESMESGLAPEDKEICKKLLISLINTIKYKFEALKQDNTVVGLIVHLICAINRIKVNKSDVVCSQKEYIMNKYNEQFHYVKANLSSIEEKLNIVFSDDEICFILYIVMCI